MSSDVAKYYNLADMLLMRVIKDAKGLRMVGQVSWTPPWGGTLNLARETLVATSETGALHALVKLPGDAALYGAIDGTSAYFALIDVTKMPSADERKSILKGVPSYAIKMFGDAVRHAFTKQVKGNLWEPLKT